MIAFENGITATEATTTTVAKFHMGNGVYRFCVIGTAYGYLHTTGGDVRTWASYSGARRVAKAYQPL